MFKYCICGEKTQYYIDPPSKCPHCGMNFADAFKKSSKKQITEVIEDDNDYEIVRVKKKNKIKKEPLLENKTLQELEAEEFSDDNFDEATAKEMAQELKESINVDDIIVNYGEDTITKLGDIINGRNQNP